MRTKNVPVTRATIGRTKNLTGTKAASVKRNSYVALGLTGRYLGGQATHRGKGSQPVGEDPDQSAGWLGQSKEAWQRCSSTCEDREVFTWKPSSRSVRCFSRCSLAANDVLEDCIDRKLTFSLVLTFSRLHQSLLPWQLFFTTRRQWLARELIAASNCSPCPPSSAAGQFAPLVARWEPPSGVFCSVMLDTETEYGAAHCLQSGRLCTLLTSPAVSLQSPCPSHPYARLKI